MTSTKAILAVTLGDPAGIGPELVLKAIASGALSGCGRIIVLGSKSVLREHAKRLSVATDENLLRDGSSQYDNFEFEDIPMQGGFEFGQDSAACGAASFKFLLRAVELAKQGKVNGIVTGPIQKESWQAAKIPHIGHTEALADQFESSAETIFVVDKLRIFFATRHVSLRQAVDLITRERIVSVLTHARAALAWFGISQPRIAVAGLNPHAGNGGMFGDEEAKVLAPAVAEARANGIDARGPFSADSVFHHCAQGHYDAVISLYHDQGHIAAKMRSFFGTVAVTTGLPVLRTSVDHGTAFDIAGKDKADPESLISAVRLASELVQRRGAAS